MAILNSTRSHSLEQTLTAIWRFGKLSPDGFTIRDLQRKRIVEDADQAASIVGLMVEKEVLFQEVLQTGGKPKIVFKLKS